MIRKTILKIFLLTFFLASAAVAEDHPEHIGADLKSDAAAKNDIAVKMENTKAFLSTAEKIISQSKNAEADTLLKNAQMMLKEGVVHYKSGQYTYSSEDLDETTKLATHAMILASNEQNWEMRDLVVYEESLDNEKREAERKEAISRQNMEETVSFIETAERILQRFPDENAFKKLVEAQDSLAVSKAMFAENNYNNCIEELSKSYKLAIGAINDAYKAHRIHSMSNSQPEKSEVKKINWWERL